MKAIFRREIIPEDSLLHLYLESRSILETPWSYDLAICLSVVGAMLKRTCWIDQKRFRVYPNMSTLLVGHSGIGKDTAIDGGEEIIKELGNVAIIGGRTSETITDSLYKLGDPAVAVILAGELSEFFGPKDYQKGMMETITDLMSTKAWKDISLKSDKEQRRIMRPTLTMLGGSTRDWLHSAMPEHAMNGGFYPRFLILCEDQTKRQVAWVKYSIPQEELEAADRAMGGFVIGLREALGVAGAIGEMVPRDGGQEAYERFYSERERYFSPQASPYAHRCRDTALRIAMISAVCRLHTYIDRHDVEFAAHLIEYVGARVDDALAPPTLHGRINRDIVKLLPTTKPFIWKVLSKKYDLSAIKRALESMEYESQVIIKNARTGIYSYVQDVRE